MSDRSLTYREPLNAQLGALTPLGSSEFVNRTQQLAEMQEAVSSLITNKIRVAVHVFYGMRGIGKTSLLQEYSRNKWELSGTCTLIEASLESADLLAPFIEIREKAEKIQPELFDDVLNIYWKSGGLEGQKTDYYKKKNNLNIIASQFLGAPEKTIDFVFDKISQYLRSDDSNSEIRKIHDIYRDSSAPSPDYLRNILPELLGWAFREAHDNNWHRHVFVLDRYDNQLASPDFPKGKMLQKFIHACNSGVFFIGSRKEIVWNNYEINIINHRLKPFGIDDTKSFLIQKGVEDNAVIDAIYRVSGGFPLKLAYMATPEYCKSFKLTPREFDTTTQNEDEIDEFIFDQVLNGKYEKIKPLLELLAVSGYFDLGLIDVLTRNFNLQIDYQEQERLLSDCIVEQAMSSPPIYKLHDLIRPYLFNKASEKTVARCIKYVTAHSQRIIVNGDKKSALAFFRKAIEAIEKATISEIALKIEANEKIIDLAYSLYDAGTWRQMNEAIESLRQSGNKTAVANFSWALCQRKIKPVEQALHSLESLRSHYNEIGRYRLSAETEIAYALSLTGKYGEAAEKFEQLYELIEYKNLTRETRKVHLVFGDILTLQGRFNSALEKIKILTNNSRDCDNSEIEFAEALRHEGHIHRFNFDFTKAKEIYKESMRYACANNSAALHAKLKTNLAENFCWHDPQKALKFANEAIEENKNLGNNIEVGKALTAQAIALTALNRITEARSVFEEALMTQATEGYASGVLFARIAGYITAIKSNQKDEAIKLEKEIYLDIEKIEVYRFLGLYVVALSDEESALDHELQKNEYEWLDLHKIKKGFSDFRKKILLTS